MIRDATAEDAAAIAQVQVDAWHAAYRGKIPDETLDAFTVEVRQERWHDILTARTGPATTIVAIRDAEVVGFGSYGPCRDDDADDGTWEIWALYVLPRVWGRGIGRTLIEEAVERMRAANATSATLWVLAANERARGFYAAAGFEFDGTTKVEERPGGELHEVRYRQGL